MVVAGTARRVLNHTSTTDCVASLVALVLWQFAGNGWRRQRDKKLRSIRAEVIARALSSAPACVPQTLQQWIEKFCYNNV